MGVLGGLVLYKKAALSRPIKRMCVRSMYATTSHDVKGPNIQSDSQ